MPKPKTTADIAAQKRSVREDLRLIWRACKLTQQLEPRELPLLFLKVLFKALTPFIDIYFSARILGVLVGSRDPQQLLLYVLLTIGLHLVVHLIGKAMEQFAPVPEMCLVQKERHLVDQAFLKTDYANLEDPQVQNLARDYQESTNMGGHNLAHKLCSRLEEMLQGALTVAFSIGMAAPMFFAQGDSAAHPLLSSSWLSLLMLAGVVGVSCLSLLLNQRGSRKVFVTRQGYLRVNRLFGYYGTICDDYRFGKELRLYKEQPFLHKGFVSINEESDAVVRKLAKIRTLYFGGTAALSALLSGCVYLFTALKALAGAFGIAGVVQYAGAINQFTGGFTGLVNSFSSLREETQNMRIFFSILDMQPVMYEGTLPVEKRDDNDYVVEFHHVSFRYPGAKEWALQDLSMKLKVGQHLAVVGRNGSGKTTFIKLLCRLYDPTQGVITLNGIDIRKYKYEEYLSLFSVVFQDFALFSFPLGQNVAASTQVDAPAAEACLQQAGFAERLQKWPLGLDTPLYKNFDDDGVEISGGEAQKIAIARALYKNAPFVILDEPTAALDPISEYEIYSKFNGIVGGRTAVYISHRLSSCRFCDDIAVFDRGRVVQRGGHEQLLRKSDGLYARLWQAQAQYYAEQPSREEQEKYSVAPIGA